MNKIILLKHLEEGLLRLKNLCLDIANGCLEAIEEIEEHFALKPYIISVKLTPSGWDKSSAPYNQTVACDGVIPDEDKQIVTVSYEPTGDNISTIIDCEIFCTKQGENTLTFTAFGEPPTVDVEFNIIIQNI